MPDHDIVQYHAAIVRTGLESGFLDCPKAQDGCVGTTAEARELFVSCEETKHLPAHSAIAFKIDPCAPRLYGAIRGADCNGSAGTMGEAQLGMRQLQVRGVY